MERRCVQQMSSTGVVLLLVIIHQEETWWVAELIEGQRLVGVHELGSWLK